MTELWRLAASDIARLVQHREVSAREAASSALARLEAVNAHLNAVVAFRPHEVLAEADAIDRALAAGEASGPLAGVPVTVKETIDQAGFATTNGLRRQRDLVATTNSPVVDSLRRAGAVILGRTNTPAFSYRWFTSNLLHGATRNPHDPALTPGGSSGGAGAAVAAGIGHLAHGTDIAGSIRYPAYACGVHGLRPSLGRVAAYNASSPERGIGAQLMAVSGPLARSIGDLRLALTAMAAADGRDPWWVPAPLDGPPAPERVTLCLRPGGLVIVPEVEAALLDAAHRLEAAGWKVDEVPDVPRLREAAALQVRLWLGADYPALLAAAEREGDPGALNVLRRLRTRAEGGPALVAEALTRRLTLAREWSLFLASHPLLLVPISAELPFPDDLDLDGEAGFARVWEAQLTLIGLPLMGLPGLAVATGKVGTVPVGVQLVADRFREDLCLRAGAVIEAAGPPVAAIDPSP